MLHEVLMQQENVSSLSTRGWKTALLGAWPIWTEATCKKNFFCLLHAPLITASQSVQSPLESRCLRSSLPAAGCPSLPRGEVSISF